MDPIYSWRSGFRHKGVDPTAAANELERLRAKHGELTPGVVVIEARSQRSSLHPIFEWEDGEAAEQYRLYQARHMLRAIRVTYPDGGESQPVFVNVRIISDSKDEFERVYKPLSEVIHIMDERASAIAFLSSKVFDAHRSFDEVCRVIAASRDNGDSDMADLEAAREGLTIARAAIARLAAKYPTGPWGLEVQARSA